MMNLPQRGRTRPTSHPQQTNKWKMKERRQANHDGGTLTERVEACVPALMPRRRSAASVVFAVRSSNGLPNARIDGGGGGGDDAVATEAPTVRVSVVAVGVSVLVT